MHHLKAAQGEVAKISKEYDVKTAYTSAFFTTLIAEQLGQVAEKYLHKGRKAQGIEVDLADITFAPSPTSTGWGKTPPQPS